MNAVIDKTLIKWGPLTRFGYIGALLLILISCTGLETTPEDATHLDQLVPSNQIQPNLISERIDLTGSTSGEFGQHIKFETISVDQGLSQSTVNIIAEDDHGFLWFGTWDGLNRYDGFQFKVFKHDPEDATSISNNTIRDILLDRDGVLWIGTDGGLNQFEREKEQFQRYQYNPENQDSISNNVVSRIFEDSSGHLWIGTLGGGLDLFDPHNEKFIHYRNLPTNPASLSSNIVWDIYEDSSGTLWIATPNGLNRLDRQTGGFIHYKHDPQNPNSLADNDVRTIFADQTTTLWVGTYGGGLDRFIPSTGQFFHHHHDSENLNSLSDNEVRVIREDLSGAIWVGTSSGLNQYRQQSDDFIRYNPGDQEVSSSTAILDIYQDSSGVYWIATSGGGLQYFDHSLLRFVHIYRHPNLPASLSNEDVTSILEDQDGFLWVGTQAGLNRYDPSSGLFTYYNLDSQNPSSRPDATISAILQDREGHIWIGTSKGLYLYEQKKDHFFPFVTDPNPFIRNVGELPSIDLSEVPVNIITQDSQGVIWIGSNGTGLIRLNPANKRVIVYPYGENDPESLNGATVLSIFEDQSGTLWIGTLRGGLNRFDPHTEYFRHYLSDPGDPQSLSDNTVTVITQDQSGALWIGTSAGLNKFDPIDQSFVQYREKDGLPNEFIHGIIEDDQGYLWISTNNGLSRFDPLSETFKNFSPRDGLQSNQFNQGAYFKSQTGELYFGGINGFNFFKPDQILENPYIPPIVLTGLTQGGETIDAGVAPEYLQELTLSWPRNYFEFEFAALSFIQPENNSYAYKLENFDQDWTNIGNRRYGRYTNLPGGTYTLRLKGSNNDGLWNEIGSSIQVTVIPPFWETTWFRWGAAFVIVFGVFVGYRLRMHNIQAHNIRLTNEIEQRTRELEQRRQVAEGLREVLILLNNDRSLEKSLNFILCQINLLTHAEKACLFQIVGSFTAQLVTSYSAQEDQNQPCDDIAKPEEGLNEEVLRWFAELAKDPSPPVIKNPQNFIQNQSANNGNCLENIQTILVIPISPEGDIFGGLAILFREHKEFTREELALINTFADQASLAIGNARLRSQAEEMAVITERNRLARDLHDAVTQTLFSASLIAEAIPDIWMNDQEEGLVLLDELRRLNRGALAEMRALLMELRPTTLEETNLPGLLIQLAEVVSGRADFQVETDISSDCQLPPDVRISLYRIAQEAMTNVVKHARASRSFLRLHSQPIQRGTDGDKEDIQIQLEIEDDGCGFDPEAVPPNHFGLENIRERAQSIGAQVIISSQPGKGTHIKVIWIGKDEHDD
jgi:ligand-binding sensor domain-containing protein/signal transduction histidine kinase